MHTPFDWDEDLDIFIEPVKDNSNQATQTSERPNNLKVKKQKHKNFNELKTHEETLINTQESNRIIRDRYLNNYDEKYIEELKADAVEETKKLKKANKKSKTKQAIDVHEKTNNFKNNGIEITARPNSSVKQPAPTPKANLKRAQSTFIKSSIKKPNTPSPALAKEIQANKTGNYELLKISSNQAIQTPQDWNLRQYKRPASKAGLYRSASAVSIKSRPANNDRNNKPVPFAMYGSGVKTKDMSLKPTHNSLANRVCFNSNLKKFISPIERPPLNKISFKISEVCKIKLFHSNFSKRNYYFKTLARYHGDKDAMMELALQNLKKQANLVANEYSVLESVSSEKFRNERSESRAWNSEYDDRYPDYSRSASREELYYKERPHGLSKSTLNIDYPVLKRGASAGAKKIYFYE